MNATKLLKQQHDEVRDLFKDYEKLDDQDRQKKLALFHEIKKKLQIHSTIEEEIFYPPLRQAHERDARKDAAEAYEEHHVIKTVLRDLSSLDPASGAQFDATVKVLRENVEHHADEEEDDLFSDARKIFSKEELEDYGQRLEARTHELEQSYPSAGVR